MTNENKKTLDVTPTKPKRVRYDVGYCKPPRNSWFLPGTSGNPKGRPEGSKNKPKDSKLTEILREELFCETVSELRGDKENVSIVRLVTQMLVDSALDGNFRAQQWVLSATSAVEAADAAEQEADYQYAKAYKEEHGGIFFRDETLELVPNPDQIYLDNRHRHALFACARNAEEIAEFEEIRAEAKRSGAVVGEAVDSADQELADPENERNGGAESLDGGSTTDESTEAAASTPDVDMRGEPVPSTREADDAPNGEDDEHLQKHAAKEGEDERLITPAPDEPEEPRLRRTAPEVEDERLRKPAPDEPEEPRLRTPAPDEPEEPRLRTPSPDDREDERLRTSTPDEPEDERLRKPAPDEREDERLRTPTSDEPEDERLRKPAPDELEDERLQKPGPDDREDERLRKPAA